jgi:membrane-associated phospholipid phosphatase
MPTSDSQTHPKKTISFEIILILATLLLGLLAINWDTQLASFLRKIRFPGDLRKGIYLSEFFAHSIGVALILATLIWTDHCNRTLLLKAAVFVAICGLVGNLGKVFVPRLRPLAMEFVVDGTFSGWDTWGIPFSGAWSDSKSRSFPSGHSATVVSLAIALSKVYPRGWFPFFMMAALACFQRMVSNSHYLSDVLGGVLIAQLLSLVYWRYFLENPNSE